MRAFFISGLCPFCAQLFLDALRGAGLGIALNARRLLPFLAIDPKFR
jgi:hypothetical protein